jgi:rod shape-determining protein MreC
MTITSLSDPRVDLRNWFYLGAVTVIFSLLEYLGVLQPIRKMGERIINPGLKTGAVVVRAVRWPYEMILFTRHGVQRIQDLEYRYNETSAQLGELTKLQEENQALRALIENSDRTLSARVVTTPILAYGYPMVGVGQTAGVRAGALVLIAQTLVGQVTEVSEYQANVRLLSHAQSQPILARTESGAEGLVKGTGSKVVLTEVPKEVVLTVGERVVTAGQPGIDRDLFLGRIVSLDQNPAAPVQTATIEQVVSFYEARVVEVTK